jgi:F0F1-type ATP synthase assembly protein I
MAKNRDGAHSAADLTRYAGLGVQFAVTLVLFAWAGIWLDGRLGTAPWFLIAGVFLGGTGAFLAILRAVPPSRRKTPYNHPPQ